jgi:hypothetical protein
MKLPPHLQQLLGFQDFDYKSPVFIDRVQSLVYNSQFFLDLRKKILSQGSPMPTPPHPNTRQCTHIKVNGVRCGSPALKDEFFCYFHTRLVKGVRGPYESRIAPSCNLESIDAVQYSLMDLLERVLIGDIDFKRAALMIRILHIAAKNAKSLSFDSYCSRQQSVTEVPDYGAQYRAEHPESCEPMPPEQAPPADDNPSQTVDASRDVFSFVASLGPPRKQPAPVAF